MEDFKILDKWFKKHDVNVLEFVGTCDDCGAKTKVEITRSNDGKITISGGAVYIESENPNSTILRCDKCFIDSPYKSQRCEVYSRVVGYYRPINAWNAGKQAEFKDRKLFDHKGI